ncbi:MAG: anthranilate phosphoribosyltransferase [Pycnora praestabilis]|nr:MAG: anthranilate phosphoribosyltransferase [Pycnora praestabilis]
MAQPADLGKSQYISITPLLKRIWPSPEEAEVTADEVALAISHIFTDQLSPVQTGALLTALHFTGWDRKADVIAKCAAAMRDAAAPVDMKALREIVRERGRKEGDYSGGLCDIVGTGGDSHSTFNISTTSSILASSLLLLSKHGNRASTSKSGSADLLASTTPTAPNIQAITPDTIAKVYEKTNYAFLFAPVFHPGMKYVATVRRELGWRTIFNLLGPLANPVESAIEARVVGVARRDLGPVFADALRMGGAKKAMIICGEEDLDEISCAGRTFCWRLVERHNPKYRESQNVADEASTPTNDEDGTRRILVEIEEFTLSPSDFGLPAHQLSEVSPGKLPHQNAAILTKLLRNEMPRDDPILHFVLMNTAALFVIAGICDADESNMGHGDNGNVIKEEGPCGGRWKEGVRRARWAIESGEAWKSWSAYVEVSNSFNT